MTVNWFRFYIILHFLTGLTFINLLLPLNILNWGRRLFKLSKTILNFVLYIITLIILLFFIIKISKSILIGFFINIDRINLDRNNLLRRLNLINWGRLLFFKLSKIFIIIVVYILIYEILLKITKSLLTLVIKNFIFIFFRIV